jgi:dethiobiotin synthetase
LLKPIFITSTGTNIGKTYLTSLIIKKAQALNFKVNAIKPIISGFNIENFNTTDTGIISAALGKNQSSIEEVSPWRFEAPLSPDQAAYKENKEIVFKELIDFCLKNLNPIKNINDIVLIEGVGGTMVPINNKYTTLDLMKALDIPVILIIGSYLGSISHTLNAYEVLIQNNININSIVISESEENNIGINQTRKTLLNHIKNISIFPLKRGDTDNIVDKILNNL